MLVIGDFDADGATSTALVLRALRGFGFAAVDFLVPNRFEYGYGLTPEIVAVAAERAPTLIITVDNGISSHAGVTAARARGIDVLITDHHLPGAELPDANVIVNPNVPGNGFASGALAGVGVAFYVCAALRRALESAGELPRGAPAVASFLDLVALGHRRRCRAARCQQSRAGRAGPGADPRRALRAGHQRAAERGAARSQASWSSSDLGFAVAPRLNAAGRLTDMSIGIRCLLTDDPAEARGLAVELDALNAQRREIEADMQLQALAAVRALRDETSGPKRSGVCLFDASLAPGRGRAWSPVASRNSCVARSSPSRWPTSATCAARRARCPACTFATCSRPSPRASRACSRNSAATPWPRA